MSVCKHGGRLFLNRTDAPARRYQDTHPPRLRTVTLGAMSMTLLPADRASPNDADERDRFVAGMVAVLLSSLVCAVVLWVSVRK